MTAPRPTFPKVGIWTGALDYLPFSASGDVAAEIESLGFGAIWIPEVAGRDPFVQLVRILEATTSLIGATGIASIWARDAIAMSSAMSSLTEPYPERVLIGLGVSHRNIVSDLRRHDYSKPIATMSSYLDAIDASPYTAERPSTPIRRVLAALGPKMLGLAAAKADGAHPYLTPVEHTAQAREILGPDALLCPEQMFVLDNDIPRGRKTARLTLGVYLAQPNYARNLLRLGFTEDDFRDGGSDKLIDRIVAIGSPEVVADRVRDHLAAGADHVCVQALVSEKRNVPLEHWRSVAPALRAIS